ncbi:hypothetical protein JSQ81_07995 [Sporosarcina sp. Marseille-Q4063]|uniref:hypothetical protein n=1 Tax=Sporosarcina sp. Marseille-Q4063 TaxID=2810514 RepID=UPI001BB03D49|nr:hypothetical protein [Sporosarcina sp. Marseille-Q4063]QUW23452.1 hypothetical protein JSQ81_07995 [Sporosarcina sp. Marseille-Q4063]
MTSTIKSMQRAFIVLGSLFLLFSIMFSTATLFVGIFPVGHELMMLSISIMVFCNAYLYPQFKSNDERSRVIREKGMFYSYFILVGFLVIFMALFQLNLINLDGYQMVCVIASLLVSTVFSSMVVVSKRI